MVQCEIINYSAEWSEKLRDYLSKTFPNYTEPYVNYCVERSCDRVPAILVINVKKEIVGCHLFFCTKAFINGEEIHTQWGHDTYLNKEYRAIAGLDLVLSIHAKKGFGLGLTRIAERIQNKLKYVFFDGVFNYYVINRFFIFSIIQGFFSIKPNIKVTNVINVGNVVFRRVSNVNDIMIPNNGFWFKDYRNIDFIRDADYLMGRFFNNKVYPYYFYSYSDGKQSAYFVIRHSFYRGIPSLVLSDYRYTDNNSQLLDSILKAVNIIALKSNLGVIIFRCGDSNMRKIIRKRIHYSTPLEFVSNRRDNSKMTFIVTGGDSDSDFLM